MSLFDYINTLGEWVLSKLDKILISIFSVIAAYVLYILIARQVTKLKNQNRLDEHVAYTLI
jgi:hypothetical protein